MVIPTNPEYNVSFFSGYTEDFLIIFGFYKCDYNMSPILLCFIELLGSMGLCFSSDLKKENSHYLEKNIFFCAIVSLLPNYNYVSCLILSHSPLSLCSFFFNRFSFLCLLGSFLVHVFKFTCLLFSRV